MTMHASSIDLDNTFCAGVTGALSPVSDAAILCMLL